jgi:hypothetical protein
MKAGAAAGTVATTGTGTGARAGVAAATGMDGRFLDSQCSFDSSMERETIISAKRLSLFLFRR